MLATHFYINYQLVLICCVMCHQCRQEEGRCVRKRRFRKFSCFCIHAACTETHKWLPHASKSNLTQFFKLFQKIQMVLQLASKRIASAPQRRAAKLASGRKDRRALCKHTAEEKMAEANVSCSKRHKRNSKYCCVPHCNNYGSSGLSFHLFPKDDTLRREWEIA